MGRFDYTGAPGEPNPESYPRDDDFRQDHAKWSAAKASGKPYHDPAVRQAMAPAKQENKEHGKGYREGMRQGRQEFHEHMSAQFGGLKAVGRVIRGAKVHAPRSQPVKLGSISRSVSAKPRRSR